ncbi:MAG: RagB/SusD family nutrient uptake outer membrane protein, partial [Carboxylicivirga sp.]|nr:RagB/SusD family nutrient uptake outer membrane protein [Carboxylicivirga sp.]
EIAKFIIQDLDSAIHYLHLKNKGACKPGRVNKQAALTMKARVALYEGTWEYYHGRKGTDYAVAGKDGEAFLQDVVEAVDDLIEIEGTNIFTDGGIYDEPYNQLSAQNDMSKVAGVFYYTVYSQELLNKSHNMYEAITGDGFCYTRRFVDMYLDKDGKPRELSAHPLTTLNEMSENLEPRFKQTIYTPNRGPIVEMPGRRSGDFLYPQIQTTGYYAGATGFRNWKGAIFDESQYRDGETDHIHIRYAEGLLAYAEAKAILGTITQGDIDKTVNLLRSRIGATPMLLSEVNGWDIDYSENKGFDNTAANIVNEIRRERCIELAAEGFRGDDIKRWALLSEAYNGWRPEGANAAEFFDYFNDPDNRPDGYTEAEWLSNALEDGNNCKVLPNGNFNALWKLPYFEDGAEGCQVVEGRDYLKAVPFNEIELYKQKAGVILTQNPGWN